MGRHGADDYRPVFPHELSGGQFMAVQPPAECLRSLVRVGRPRSDGLGGQSCGGTTFVVVPALLVRVGRPRADGLGCDGSSLSERADSIIKT